MKPLKPYTADNARTLRIQMEERENFLMSTSSVLGFALSFWAFYAVAAVGFDVEFVDAMLAGAFAACVSFIVVAIPVSAILDSKFGIDAPIRQLSHYVQPLVSKAEDLYAEVMDLRPPAAAVEDLIAHRAEFEEVVNELIQVSKLDHGGELKSSTPYRWIEAYTARLEELKTELKAVRMQSYSLPRALPSLAQAKTAVTEEQAFLNDVLNRYTDDDFVDRILGSAAHSPLETSLHRGKERGLNDER